MTSKEVGDLYEELHDKLLERARFRLSSYELAEDAVNESFTRLIIKINSGLNIENPKAYLYKILFSIIVDYYRKKKVFSLEGLVDEESGEKFDIPDLSHEKIIDKIDLKLVMDNLKKINPSLAQSLVLRYVYGYTPTEIAKKLNITSNAASVRISRAKEELRKVNKIYEYGRKN